MAGNFRFRRADGGSTIRGGASLRGVDAQTYSYAASGGIRYGGQGVTAFLPAAQPAADAPQGHGVGRRYDLRSPALPIAIRQYGDKVTFRYRASGGIRYGGEATVQFTRNAVVYQFASSGGITNAGTARAARWNDDDDYLALAA
jgi:hypothetical protein